MFWIARPLQRGRLRIKELTSQIVFHESRDIKFIPWQYAGGLMLPWSLQQDSGDSGKDESAGAAVHRGPKEVTILNVGYYIDFFFLMTSLSLQSLWHLRGLLFKYFCRADSCPSKWMGGKDDYILSSRFTVHILNLKQVKPRESVHATGI